MYNYHAVVKLTNIRNVDLLGERPLSVVLTEFFTWITTTAREYAESTGKHYFPGNCDSPFSGPLKCGHHFLKSQAT